MRIPLPFLARLLVCTKLSAPRQNAKQCLDDNCYEVADLKRNSYQHNVIGSFPTAFCSGSEYRVNRDSEETQSGECWQAKQEAGSEADRRTASEDNGQAAPPMINDG